MKRLLIIAGVLTAAMMGLTGCYKDVIYPAEDPYSPPPYVSFKNDLQPLFSAKCATSGCHVTGAKKPVLEAAVAFNNLTGGGYVDLLFPESSVLYRAVKPDGGSMPYLSAAEAKKVLAWIKNGAPNN